MARFLGCDREAILYGSFDNYHTKLGIYLEAIEQAERQKAQNTQSDGR